VGSAIEASGGRSLKTRARAGPLLPPDLLILKVGVGHVYNLHWLSCDAVCRPIRVLRLDGQRENPATNPPATRHHIQKKSIRPVAALPTGKPVFVQPPPAKVVVGTGQQRGCRSSLRTRRGSGSGRAEQITCSHVLPKPRRKAGSPLIRSADRRLRPQSSPFAYSLRRRVVNGDQLCTR